MQANRIIYCALICILRNKPTRRSIHISRTEIIQPRSFIKLFAAITVTVLSRALGFQQITKSIIAVSVSYNATFISQSNNRTVSVIEIE